MNRDRRTVSNTGGGQRGRGVWIVFLLLLVATVAAWRYSEYRKGQVRLALEQQQAVERAQKDAAEKQAQERAREAELKALEQRLAAEKEQQDVLATSHRELDGLLVRWEDGLKLASTTSRISLSGPVTALQAIRRDTEQLVVAPCLDFAKKQLIESMSATIDGFLDFMRNQHNVGDKLASSSFELAGTLMEGFRSARKACPR